MRFWKSLKSTGESLAGTLERTARKNSPKPNNHHHRESGGHLHLSPNTPRSSSRKVRAGSETSSGDPIYEDYYDYNNSLQSSGLTFVELIKRPGTHLGVIVSGGIDTGLTPKIVDLIPGSWAQRSDVLCIGDVIVSVNGISTETMTQKDLVKTLDVSDRIQLEVKYKLPSYRHRTHTRKITTKFIQITLKKENGSFGVVIRGGNHDDPRRVRPFTVMYVTHKSVANKEGTLRVNDRILSINGAALRGMKLPELQSLLYRQDGGDTVFTVEYDVAIHPDHELGRPILVEIRKEGSDILGFGLNKCNDSGHVYIESVKTGKSGRAVWRDTYIDQISDLIRGENNRLVQLEILPGIFSNARSSRCSIPSPTYSTLSSSHHKRSKSSSRYPSGSSLGNGFQPSSTSPTPPKVTGKESREHEKKICGLYS
ncbi:GRIP [Lepeophtheirus salmonis]|uniref:GRIP n=1 Tax=Lepeophtheirus salmonis TaxID=72036 RepID=A0A7R8D429_LEPSM|nr:GRIP [Lepeophtheirus salmonis]CAF3017550.1 GRIP [Lepeophtheirus salmonis]